MKTKTKNKPWMLDDGRILLEDQISQLSQDIGTEREWVCIGFGDREGVAEVAALAHPINAAAILRAVNTHHALAAALEAAKELLDRNGLYIVNEAGGLYGATGAAIERALRLAKEHVDNTRKF